MKHESTTKFSPPIGLGSSILLSKSCHQLFCNGRSRFHGCLNLLNICHHAFTLTSMILYILLQLNLTILLCVEIMISTFKRAKFTFIYYNIQELSITQLCLVIALSLISRNSPMCKNQAEKYEAFVTKWKNMWTSIINNSTPCKSYTPFSCSPPCSCSSFQCNLFLRILKMSCHNHVCAPPVQFLRSMLHAFACMHTERNGIVLYL